MTKLLPRRAWVAVLGLTALATCVVLFLRLSAPEHQPGPEPTTSADAFPSLPANDVRPGARLDLHGDPLPDGAIVRLGTVHARTPAEAVTFSSDGKILVTLEFWGTVEFWDTATGRRRAVRLPAPGSRLLGGGGRVLVGRNTLNDEGGQRVVELLDTVTGNLLHRLPVANDTTNLGTYCSGDGRIVVAHELREERPGQDVKPDTVIVWEVATGRRLSTFAVSRGLGDSALSPDGRRFVGLSRVDTVQREFEITCWDTLLGAELWKAPSAGRSLTFSGDGCTVVTWTADPLRVRLHDATTGKPAPGLPPGEDFRKNRPHPEYVQLHLAHDNRTLLLIVPWGDLIIWDLQKGKEVRVLKDVGWNCALAPDGRSVVTAGGALGRWDLATGKPLWPDTSKFGHSRTVSQIVFSSDGKRLASASGDDRTIRLWDTTTGKPLHIIDYPVPGYGFDALRALAFTPEGRHLITASTDATIRTHDASTGQEVAQARMTGRERVNTKLVRLDQDRKTLVLLDEAQVHDGSDWRTKLDRTTWNVATGKRLSLQTVDAPGERRDLGMREPPRVFAPDGSALLDRQVDDLVLIDWAAGGRRSVLKGKDPKWIYSPATISDDGQRLAAFAENKRREPRRELVDALWRRASARPR